MDPDPVDYIDEDLEEVTDEENGEDIAVEMGDMDLQNYDEEDDLDELDEMHPDGAEAQIPDDAEVCFKQHKGSVFCCAVEPTDGLLAASGGEDDKAYLWNVESGDLYMECSGHKDSVTCLSFSHDGNHIATGDMSGIIKVWNVDSKEEVWMFEGSDLEWLNWHPSANVLLAGTSEGDTWMWKIPSGNTKMMQGHGCSSTCGRVMHDGKRCVTGYEDGSLKVWDLKEASSLHHVKGGSGTNHKESITSLDCHKDNTIVLSGSVDGTAKLTNTNNGKVVGSFSAGDIDARIGETNSVESVGFSLSQPLAAVGSLNGILGIWDVPTQKLRHQCKNEAGVVRLEWDKSSPCVFVAGLDGQVKLWDCRSGQVMSTWTGHEGEVLDLSVSRDGNTILTASSDSTCRTYKITQPDR